MSEQPHEQWSEPDARPEEPEQGPLVPGSEGEPAQGEGAPDSY